MEKPENNGRQKLELKLNETARVKLLKDKPYEGSSAYGPYWLYSFDHEGVEKAYFAPVEVHQEISKMGLKAGDEIILKKSASQNGRRVVARITIEPIPKAEVPLPKRAEDGLKEIMERSLREAVEITRSVEGVPFQNEDIQKIASCLFIART
jgi:hypothetical protein